MTDYHDDINHLHLVLRQGANAMHELQWTQRDVVPERMLDRLAARITELEAEIAGVKEALEDPFCDPWTVVRVREMLMDPA